MPSSGRTWQTSVPGEKRGLARDCDKTESTDIRKEKTSSPVISARHRSSLVLWVQYLLPLTAEEQTSGGQRFGRTLQLKNPRSAQRSRTACREPNFSSKVRIPRAVSALYPYLVS
ncbi:hypothetical protein CH063_12772 [Colletotrichum higginsianum]|uniref:Uncharacterized protein n=1 Tax=Colletotrichum higginsianum (strain IMI 349063) TaxID=759273 RepID=H1VRQ9_COLHI|nr:hypothetical protein CH063_12772 [Colletotrichum higginsianum]